MSDRKTFKNKCSTSEGSFFFSGSTVLILINNWTQMGIRMLDLDEGGVVVIKFKTINHRLKFVPVVYIYIILFVRVTKNSTKA